MAQLNESQTHVLTLLRQTFHHQTEKSATEALERLDKENGYAMVMLELLAQQGLSIEDRQVRFLAFHVSAYIAHPSEPRMLSLGWFCMYFYTHKAFQD